jgi:hypothetical protein
MYLFCQRGEKLLLKARKEMLERIDRMDKDKTLSK